ncbi:nuclear transport factor 2 domain-containing protein [Xylariaceae sp. FL1019]|nr:nuclear transport factor 2 domain-containing protein [Xylariaceae sp. FL1019]
MANLPTPPTQSQVVSDAATSFVDAYYEALNKKHSLAQFYASTSNNLTTAAVKPDISVNGQVVESMAALEALVQSQGSHVHYEVTMFDAHPVNPNYVIGCPETLDGSTGTATTKGKIAKSIENGERLSFSVHVGGTVKYGKAGANDTATTPASAFSNAPDGPIEKAFNEAWLLVPHWEAHSQKAPRGLRKWVVVSQNYRSL